MKKVNRNIIYIVLGFMVVLLMGGGLFLALRQNPKLSNLAQAQKIVVETAEGTLTVFRDGRVMFDTGGEVLTENWEPDKVDAFFKYFLERYGYSDEYLVSEGDTLIFEGEGGQTTVVIPTDDELVDAVEDDIEDENNDGDDGEDISDYFGSPTPTPTAGPTGTPGPTYPPGGAPEGCLYWRLSFCSQWQPPPTFTPSPTPTFEVVPPTCEDLRNKEGGHTVITDSNCLEVPDTIEGGGD